MRHVFDDYRPFSAAPRAPTDGRQPLEVVLEELRDEAIRQFSSARLESGAPEVEEWIRLRGRELLRAYNDRALTDSRPRIEQSEAEVLQAMLDDLLGLGPVEKLLHLPDVEDIALNGPDDIWIKRRGRWEFTGESYASPQALLMKLNRAIARTGRQAGPLAPIVDAPLRGGHRLSIVTEPLADPWPAAVIRVHREINVSMEDLVARGGGEVAPAAPAPIPDYFAAATPEGVFTPLAATFLHMAVVAGMNILVIGATGVGKTTTLSALGKMIPPERRILVIEDTRELRMRTRRDGRAENCVYFTTRPETTEGAPAIGQAALVRAALRQRPDALTIGEARGAEVFDLLKALWTGHRNGLTSIHAENLGEVSERIRMMLQEAAFSTEVGEETVALWIAKAFHLGLLLRLTDKGRRYVEEIVEFTGGVEGRLPTRNVLFSYVPGQGLRLRSGRLQHEAMLRQAGYSFDLIRQAALEHGEMAA